MTDKTKSVGLIEITVDQKREHDIRKWFHINSLPSCQADIGFLFKILDRERSAALVLEEAVKKTIDESWIRVTLRRQDGAGFQIIVPAAIDSIQPFQFQSLFNEGLWKEGCKVESDNGPNSVKENLAKALTKAKQIREGGAE